MLRLDRNDLADIPRPVYELLVDFDGPDALVGVMVSDDTPLPCKVELFAIVDPSEFLASVEGWLGGLPYFDQDHATWRRVAQACAQRFADHIFSDARHDG